MQAKFSTLIRLPAITEGALRRCRTSLTHYKSSKSYDFASIARRILVLTENLME